MLLHYFLIKSVDVVRFVLIIHFNLWPISCTRRHRPQATCKGA